MKIVDCIPFFNELDILDIRLAELAPVVDRFVIAEATTTFTGLPKPLYFAENRERYAAYAGKIVHVVVEETLPGAGDWEREFFQKNCMSRGLTDLAPDDVVVICDTDEIPRRAAMDALRARPPGKREIVCLELDWREVYLDFKRPDRWLRNGPRAVRRSTLGSVIDVRRVRGPADNPLRDLPRWWRACLLMRGPVSRRVIPDAGWHFSYIGGNRSIALKSAAIPAHGKGRRKARQLPGEVEAVVERGDEVERYVERLSAIGAVPVLIDDAFPELVKSEPWRFEALLKPGGPNRPG